MRLPTAGTAIPDVVSPAGLPADDAAPAGAGRLVDALLVEDGLGHLARVAGAPPDIGGLGACRPQGAAQLVTSRSWPWRSLASWSRRSSAGSAPWAGQADRPGAERTRDPRLPGLPHAARSPALR